MSRHPLFENFEPMKLAVTEWMARLISENRVQHHASKSRHGQAYKTSFFSQRPDTANCWRTSYLDARKSFWKFLRKTCVSAKFIPPDSSDYLYAAWDGYLEKLYTYVEKAAAGFPKTLTPIPM